jgi:uncharacterized protein YjdB
MACGCTDNKKLNNNIQLENNKKLSIDSIQGLSLDAIINLYRDGYRLDGLGDSEYNNVSNIQQQISDTTYPKITSMVASPSFSYVEATKGGIGIMTFIALVNNGGPRGMIRLKVFNKTTGNCVEDASMQTDHCIEASYNTYIPSGLLSLVYAIKFSGTEFNTGCLRAYTCSSGENCDASTCTIYSTSASATNDNISIGIAAGVHPNAVTNLILTPGNGTIVANWTEPTNTSVFAYLIALTRVSDSVELARGYIRSNSLTMANLTNGTQYRLRVVPMSYDYYTGTGAEQTATPSAPTLNSIVISPPSASVNVGATQQLTAVCKDQNNNTMACPSLTWSSSNNSKATVNSSGLITGVSAGSANITASASGVTSNQSAITVTGTVSTLTSIVVSPASAPVLIGGTRQLTVTCKDQNNNTMVCPTLTWSSNNPTKATVNSSGLVSGIAEGIASITASSSGVTSNSSVMTVSATLPQESGGGMIVIAAVALAAAMMFAKK